MTRSLPDGDRCPRPVAAIQLTPQRTLLIDCKDAKNRRKQQRSIYSEEYEKDEDNSR
jgi:hypothetical protein